MINLILFQRILEPEQEYQVNLLNEIMSEQEMMRRLETTERELDQVIIPIPTGIEIFI